MAAQRWGDVLDDSDEEDDDVLMGGVGSSSGMGQQGGSDGEVS